MCACHGSGAKLFADGGDARGEKPTFIIPRCAAALLESDGLIRVNGIVALAADGVGCVFVALVVRRSARTESTQD